MRMKTRKGVVMKRIAFAVIVLALAVSAGFRGTSAQPAAQAESELLSLLPDGSGVVVVDVQKILSSSFWTTISQQDKVRSAIEKVQSDISEIGLRLEDLQTVALGLPASGMKDITGAVTGNFDQANLLLRLRADEKVRLTSETYKGIEIHKVNKAGSNDQAGSEEVAFAFYNSATTVFGNIAGVRASVDAQSGEKPSIVQNTKLGNALAETSPAAIRFALAVTPGMTSAIKSDQLPLPDFSSISVIFGTAEFTTAIDLNATLRNDNAEHAQAIANQLNGLLAMAKGFLGSSGDPKMAAIVGALKTVTVTASDVDVKITGNLPGEVLAQVLR